MKKILLLMLLCLICKLGMTQPFSLDTIFSPQYNFSDYYDKNSSGRIYGCFQEQDGRLVIYGFFHDNNFANLAHGIRLMPDGSLDPNWNPPLFWGQTDRTIFNFGKGDDRYFFVRNEGISVRGLNGQNIISHYAIRDTFYCGGLNKPYFFKDGSFLTGMMNCAWQDSLGNWNRMNFARVDSSGWVDFSFDHNTDDFVETVDRYDSTRFIVYGRWISVYDSIPVHQMFRIYEDGTLDTTFQLDPNILFSGIPLHIQEDGKVIVGRAAMQLAGRPDYTIFLRLNPNGSIDSSFNIINEIPMSGYGSVIYAAIPTTDGGLLIGGQFEQYDGYPRGNIVKTDADGFIDTRYLNGAGVDSTNAFWGGPEWVINIIPGQNDTYYVMGDFLLFDGQPVKPIIRLLGLSHTVGLEEEVRPRVVRVFPNPATDEVTFAWDQIAGFGEVEVRLFDLQGRLLAEQAWPPGIQEYTFSLPEHTGTIVYEVTSGEMVERGKLVVWK